jgi:hypothetical protein
MDPVGSLVHKSMAWTGGRAFVSSQFNFLFPLYTIRYRSQFNIEQACIMRCMENKIANSSERPQVIL